MLISFDLIAKLTAPLFSHLQNVGFLMMWLSDISSVKHIYMLILFSCFEMHFYTIYLYGFKDKIVC